MAFYPPEKDHYTSYPAGSTDYQFYEAAEAERRKNETKLRFRHVDIIPNEDTKLLILHVINSAFYSSMSFWDIVSCERVTGWEDSWMELPRDIVVTFLDKDLRDCVYVRRDMIHNHGDKRVRVLDELGKQRVAIWRLAAQTYGPDRVDTYKGSLEIRGWDDERYVIETDSQFYKLQDKMMLFHVSEEETSEEDESESESESESE